MAEEKIEKTTLVCRLTDNPNQVICDVYSANGKLLSTKILPKDKVKDLLE